MIFVDPLSNYGFVLDSRRTRKTWKTCHMFSDKNSKNELLNIAQLINMKSSWIQKSRRGIWHFDLIESKRNLAIKNGAIPVSRREAVKILKTCGEK